MKEKLIAEYYRQYLDIVEKFIRGFVCYEEADEMLYGLNQISEHTVPSDIIRNDLPGSHLVPYRSNQSYMEKVSCWNLEDPETRGPRPKFDPDEEDGSWVPSDVCY